VYEFIDKLKNKIIKKTVGISSAEALTLFIEASNHPWMILPPLPNRETLQRKRNILCGYQCQVRPVL